MANSNKTPGPTREADSESTAAEPPTCAYQLWVERPVSRRERRLCGNPAEFYCAGLPYCEEHSTGRYACGSERPLESTDVLDL